MSLMADIFARGWDNFAARPDGMFGFRFFVQPAVAALIAIRRGSMTPGRAAPHIFGRRSPTTPTEQSFGGGDGRIYARLSLSARRLTPSTKSSNIKVSIFSKWYSLPSCWRLRHTY